MMFIGIEAERANIAKKTGVEHYTKQLILHLAKIDSQNQYILYLRTKPQEWFLSLPKNFKIKVIPFPIFWTQIRISIEMLLHPVDVLMIPASALPIIHAKKSVVTIHDLAWLFFPATFTWFNRNFLNWSTKFAVKSASKIIAVSQSTKADLIKYYHVSSEKIMVVHHGFDQMDSNNSPFSPSLINLPVGRQGGGLGGVMSDLPEKYILFLSTIQPRKNLANLIEAFKLLKQEHPELPHKLVVAGKPGWKYQNLLKLMDDNKGLVVYLNHVSDAERFSLLKQAQVLVLPSFYEGFGLAILEAFSAGVPVATSNISSMPEVAGEAALYFNPRDVNDIKNALKTIIFDKSLCENLINKGRERLRQFSWEKCAKETLVVLKNA